MTAETQGGAPIAADDSGVGLAMFLVFSVAILIVTGAVALLALVDSWWMLGLAFVVHVVMTAIVTATIVRAVSARTLAVSRVDGEAPAGSRPEVRSRRRPAVAHF